MKILIKSLMGTTFEFDVDEDMTLADFQSRVSEETKIHITQIRLIFDRKVIMEDILFRKDTSGETKLIEYLKYYQENIGNEITLYLMLKIEPSRPLWERKNPLSLKDIAIENVKKFVGDKKIKKKDVFDQAPKGLLKKLSLYEEYKNYNKQREKDLQEKITTLNCGFAPDKNRDDAIGRLESTLKKKLYDKALREYDRIIQLDKYVESLSWLSENSEGTFRAKAIRNIKQRANQAYSNLNQKFTNENENELQEHFINFRQFPEQDRAAQKIIAIPEDVENPQRQMQISHLKELAESFYKEEGLFFSQKSQDLINNAAGFHKLDDHIKKIKAISYNKGDENCFKIWERFKSKSNAVYAEYNTPFEKRDIELGQEHLQVILLINIILNFSSIKYSGSNLCRGQSISQIQQVTQEAQEAYVNNTHPINEIINTLKAHLQKIKTETHNDHKNNGALRFFGKFQPNSRLEEYLTLKARHAGIKLL